MAKKNIGGGVFITFEGPEGSGKTTQSKLLYQYLKNEGYNVVLIHEPGTTALGRKIRSILLDPKNRKITPISEMLLYMVSRAQLIQDKIKPALEKKKIIICDRFLDSTLAYQGYGLGVDLEMIKKIGKLICQDIFPCLTIMLDLAVNVGLRRAKKIKDRIERRSLNYHHKVRKGYLTIAKDNPKRIKLVSAEADRLDIHIKIKRIVDDLIRETTDDRRGTR